MDVLRTATNPWGQDVLVGVAWDLVWVAVIASAAFVVGHALWAGLRRSGADPADGVGFLGGEEADVPEQIVRHTAAARAFHWLMSLSMFVLLATAFVPVLGLQFPWVTIHWVAGLALLATVAYHVVHAIGWQDFWAMWMDGRDVRDGLSELRHAFGWGGGASVKAGKYPVDHKLYHHVVVLVSVAAIGTGVLMSARIDTAFWAGNPYLLSDTTWGVFYVVHGLSGVALIGLVTAHVYFAVRPEKRWITWSMIRGWIHRDDYLAHHDPERWVLPGAPPSRESTGGTLAPNSVQAPEQDI